MVKSSSFNASPNVSVADRIGELGKTQVESRMLPNENELKPSTSADAKKNDVPRLLDKNALESMNESLQKAGSNILFEPDESSGKMLFLMKDAETGETIRQIPNEVVLKISQAIGEFLKTAQFEGKSASGASLTSAISGMVTNLSV
jgi:uncharacterized FlaG/YvyC family protein